MPTINDATVVASAYTTSASARPQRLSNGWLIEAVLDTTISPNQVKFFVSKDNFATTPTQIAYATVNTLLQGFSVTSIGTKVYLIFGNSNQNISFASFDASTVTGNPNVYSSGGIFLDISQTALSGLSLEKNEAGTELHATWASKNAAYPNSFNIRYAKGTINADGSVTWGVVEQWTAINTAGSDCKNPSITHNGVKPIVTFDHVGGGFSYILAMSTTGMSTAANSTFLKPYSTVFSISSSYTQSSPSAIFVPQSVNGLANGRIWVAWSGKDSTETAQDNIRVSYSDDGGVTWSTMQKLTTGNVTNNLNWNASITANKSNAIFVLYNKYTNGVNSETVQLAYNGTSWTPTTIQSNGSSANYTNPSTLFELTMNMSAPLFIYKNNAKVGFYGTWTVTNISIPVGSIGTKSDRASLLSYSITTDGAMSQVTEKVNGVTVDTKTLTSGQSTTVSLDQAEWDAVKYGKYATSSAGLNTLEISMGTEKWTYTFDKRNGANDDLLSVVKSVQDAQTTLIPAVKSKLASAITSKGGTATGADSWDTLETAIKNITLNKKEKEGTFTISGASVSVTGLGFTPRVLLISLNANYIYYGFSDFNGTAFYGLSNNALTQITTIARSSDGFTVPLNATNFPNGTWKYYAGE